MTRPIERRSIMVDWGTTNLRAYLIAPNGTRLASITKALGVKQIKRGTCAKVLDELIKDWVSQYQIEHILLAGMVGSEIGWRDVTMVTAPSGLSDLVNGAIAVNIDGDVPALIVPGVQSDGSCQSRGMMRGEELQALGALTLTKSDSGLMCLPGSHSKWVSARDMKITGISTFMTGELFDLISGQSVLRDCVEQPAGDLDLQALADGVELTKTGNSMMELMFTLRTEFVTHPTLSKSQRFARLSGIIIGSELRAALKNKQAALDTPVTLVGDGHIAAAYAVGFKCFGKKIAQVGTTDAFLTGCKLFLKSSHLAGNNKTAGTG